MTTGIYEIVNTVTGNRYVGSAAHLQKRWNCHRYRLIDGSHHNRHLQSSWKKHGAEAFKFTPLLVCSKENLLMFEQLLIDALNPEYNVLRIAGTSLGRKATIETRAKISAKAIGRKRSPESIEKSAAALRGVKLPPERVAKMLGNKYAAGVVFSAERRAMISQQLTGMKRPKDAEYRAKIAAALRGRKATPEHRANQSAAQLGKKRGPYKKRVAEVLS